MARCEDYPCCGHEAGECPRYNTRGERMCVNGCASVATSNGECNKCRNRHARRAREYSFDGTGQDQE